LQRYLNMERTLREQSRYDRHDILVQSDLRALRHVTRSLEPMIKAADEAIAVCARRTTGFASACALRRYIGDHRSYQSTAYAGCAKQERCNVFLIRLGTHRYTVRSATVNRRKTVYEIASVASIITAMVVPGGTSVLAVINSDEFCIVSRRPVQHIQFDV
jgi:hypothetical protein